MIRLGKIECVHQFVAGFVVNAFICLSITIEFWVCFHPDSIHSICFCVYMCMHASCSDDWLHRSRCPGWMKSPGKALLVCTSLSAQALSSSCAVFGTSQDSCPALRRRQQLFWTLSLLSVSDPFSSSMSLFSSSLLDRTLTACLPDCRLDGQGWTGHTGSLDEVSADNFPSRRHCFLISSLSLVLFVRTCCVQFLYAAQSTMRPGLPDMPLTVSSGQASRRMLHDTWSHSAAAQADDLRNAMDHEREEGREGGHAAAWG